MKLRTYLTALAMAEYGVHYSGVESRVAHAEAVADEIIRRNGEDPEQEIHLQLTADDDLEFVDGSSPVTGRAKCRHCGVVAGMNGNGTCRHCGGKCEPMESEQ